ncbi:MAG: hypothetical protein MHM6MM_002228 [Cercozoa sp. M6MM]
MSLKHLFTYKPHVASPYRAHNVSRQSLAWDSRGERLAVVAGRAAVHVIDRQGKLLKEVPVVQPKSLAAYAEKRSSGLNILRRRSSALSAGSGSTGGWAAAIVGAVRAGPDDDSAREACSVAWRSDSSQLAVRLAQAPFFVLWTCDDDIVDTVDVTQLLHAAGAKGKAASVSSAEVTVLEWCTMPRLSSLLAIGTRKGHLIVLDVATGGATVLLQRHTKPVQEMKWTKTGYIVSLGADRSFAISAVRPSDEGLSKSSASFSSVPIVESLAEGTRSFQLHPVRHTILKFTPTDLRLSSQKTDSPHGKSSNASSSSEDSSPMRSSHMQIPKSSGSADDLSERTVSMITGGRAVMLHDVQRKEPPVELQFQPKYGSVCRHAWFGDGYLIVAFSRGNVVIISTHMKEIGEELHGQNAMRGAAIIDLAVAQPEGNARLATHVAIAATDHVPCRHGRRETKTWSHSSGLLEVACFPSCERIVLW